MFRQRKKHLCLRVGEPSKAANRNVLFDRHVMDGGDEEPRDQRRHVTVAVQLPSITRCGVLRKTTRVMRASVHGRCGAHQVRHEGLKYARVGYMEAAYRCQI